MGQNAVSKKKKSFIKSRSRYDYQLVCLVVVLSMIGLIMIFSTTYYNDAAKHGGNIFYTVSRQAVFTTIAIVTMLFVSKVDYHKLAHLAKYAYPISVLLGILVLFIGKEVNGQKRWFAIGPISFQPAEFAKITLILLLASFCDKMYGRKLWYYRVLFAAACITLPIFLPVASANLSSGLIIFGIAFCVMFVASYRKWIFAASIVGGVGAVVAAFQSGLLEQVLDSYQMDRIYAWFDPVAYSTTNGFQTVQGLYAIGAGGLFGKGLGESIQKMGYLPEAQNDMIFSIICEELGLVGAGIIICLFVVMVWRFMVIATNSPDFLGLMIVTGVMSHISLQVLMNIAVVTNSMPNTGISLPFVSYGGSSVLFLMIEIGIVLNVSSQIKKGN